MSTDMAMSDIVTNVGTFVTAVGSNAVLQTVVVLLIAAAIGRLAFRTIKRFVK